LDLSSAESAEFDSSFGCDIKMLNGCWCEGRCRRKCKYTSVSQPGQCVDIGVQYDALDTASRDTILRGGKHQDRSFGFVMDSDSSYVKRIKDHPKLTDESLVLFQRFLLTR